MKRNIRFPNSRSYVAVARKATLDAVREFGLSESKLEEFGYAVGEALANAVEHGYREDSYLDVRVHAMESDRAIVVEVEDSGMGFNPSEVKDPQAEAVRGYGLQIMRATADRVSFERNGRLVRLRKYLGDANIP